MAEPAPHSGNGINLLMTAATAGTVITSPQKAREAGRFPPGNETAERPPLASPAASGYNKTMQAVDIKYLELVDPRLSANKFYLLVRYEDAGQFLVTRRWGARGSLGSDKGKVPYLGSNSYAARSALDALYTEKRSEGYRDVWPVPPALTALINATLKAGMPAGGPAVTAAPVKAAIPTIPVPAPVGPKAVDGHTLNIARTDRSWSICRIPANGRRTYCVIGAASPSNALQQIASGSSGGVIGSLLNVRLLAPIPAASSPTGYEADPNLLSGRYPLLIKALVSPTPVLEDTTFDGFLEEAGPATKFTLVDILVYRGADVRRFPLARRTQLLEQAVAELESDNQLPANWRIAKAGPKPMVGERILVRHLADRYEPSARWFTN